MNRSVLAIIIVLLIAQAVPARALDLTGGRPLPLHLDGRPLPLHLDRKDTAELLQMLNDECFLYRGAAARELGRRKATEAIQPLRALLMDRWGLVRQDAAEALLELGQTDIMPTLRGFLSSASTSARLHAAEALARHGDDSGFDIAYAELASKFPDDRGQAIRALAASQNDDVAYSALEAGLKDNEIVRRTVVHLLGERPGKRSVELLGTALLDPERSIRGSAIASLGRIGTRDVIPLLIRALSDRERSLRYYAASTLNRLANPNLSTTSTLWDDKVEVVEKHWSEWWEANKDKPLPAEKN